MLFRTLLTAIILFILWLLLSGHLSPLLLCLGVLSCVFAAWISHKLKLLNPDFTTLKLNFKLPMFVPWFFVEVVKSNLDVCWRILHPKMPIEPKFITVKTPQYSDVAKAVYANCITLTPGTYSVDTDENSIVVHALSEKVAKELREGEMGKRIAALDVKSNNSLADK